MGLNFCYLDDDGGIWPHGKLGLFNIQNYIFTQLLTQDLLSQFICWENPNLSDLGLVSAWIRDLLRPIVHRFNERKMRYKNIIK